MSEQEWFNKDFYAVLGVDKDADEATIKKAYRKLARKWHPDQNPGDQKAEEQFKAVGEAYQVLSDPEQRQRYNAIRQMASGGARFSAGAGGTGSGAGGFEDLFASMFGGRAGSGTRVYTNFGRGSGGQSFEDMLSGLFSGGSPAGNAGAGGGYGAGYSANAGASGWPGGGYPGDAGYPGSAGAQPRPRRGADVKASAKLTFKQAYEGATIRLKSAGKQVTVRVPAGVHDGQKIRVRGKGQPGTGGGGAGDLMVTVKVPEHPVFSMEGDTLRVKLPVTVPEAVFGGEVEVPLPDETTVTVKVPAGTSTGKTLRIRGAGVKKPGKKRADVLAEIQIVLPEKPNSKIKATYTDLQAAMQDQYGEWNPRKQLEL